MIANHLWQSTFFAIAAGILTMAFRKNRAEVRFWIWFCASLKFLLPFALLMTLGGQMGTVPAARIIATPAISTEVVRFVEPFSVPATFRTPAPETRNWIPLLTSAIWCAGFLAVLLLRVRAWRRIRAAIAASTPIELLAGADVRTSPGLLEPGVVGLLHPVLLLPEGIAERLTPAQLSAVLSHERCHIRRHDNWFAAIHMFVEAVFWFHPLVWWIGAKLLAERERACDEAVLRSGSAPLIYAEGILNVCKLYAESPLACVSGVTGADLRRRIEVIMTNGLSLQLSVTRKAVLAAAGVIAVVTPIAVGVLSSSLGHAQSPASTQKFEVASIKPCKVGEPTGGRKGNTKTGGGGRSSSPGRLSTGCDTVESLIRDAYVMYASGSLIRDPSNPPVEGGPAWIRSERYQINATAPGAPSEGLMRGPMLQTLLEDRLHLKIHRESREVPVYAVTVAKGGPKLKPFQEGSCVIRENPFTPPTPEEQKATVCRAILRDKGPLIAAEATGTNIGALLKLLYLVLDRPIIDRTGLAGRYDITVEFARPDRPGVFRPLGEPVPPPTPLPEASDDLAGTSIFAAFEKQLGLKIEPSKGPRDFWVIDSLQHPTAN